MNVKDVLKRPMDLGDMIVQRYVGDLSDEDLRMRPAEGMNPIAWQLGHLISVERSLVEGIRPGSCPPLPERFDEVHGKDKGVADDMSGYLGRDEYLRLWKAQRDATKAVLDGLSDEELAAPYSHASDFIPTVWAALSLIGGHAQMHAGQFVPVRRKLGKPVVI